MKWKNLLLLIFLAALWGPSFLFIKVAVAEIPPLTLVLGRVGIAAVLLYLILRLQNGRLPAIGPVWKHLAFVALIHNAIPFVLFSWGEQYIDSALASILNGTVPLFTIILAHFLVADDRLTPTKVIGVLIGFVGMIILVAPSFSGGIQGATGGILAITLASFLYGIALVYGRNHLRGLKPMVAPTGQMLLATLYLLPVALIVERPFSLPPPSLQAILAMLALAVFGSAIALSVYYKLLERADASYVSMTTYVIPVFGVILGVLVLDEQLTWPMIIGCGFIIFGVMIVNGLFNGVRLMRPKQEPLLP